ncbi:MULTISPECIES: glutathione binding-like protein [Sorangium]|uniref:GST C-terminal domain-containing protein n=1 Tax=Sorangium cellulosum TaxID=56 RepID=A0A4P2QWF6_SORCE|nr:MULTISPECIES: glutathione binding-like protein [Sorangium]AUX34784.1 uncharacterized protein SOCE836_069610 [Sorangium cellulosum]WCQ94097.1 hypothetical protein NQZ70_06854 [Sorangium sp. Soce836]
MLTSFSEIEFLDRKVFPLGLGAAMRFTLRTRTAHGRDGTLDGVDVFELNEQRKIAKITSYLDAPGASAAASAPQAGALEVYWASGSPPAWRVLLLLAVKGCLTRRSSSSSRERSTRRRRLADEEPAVRAAVAMLHEELARLEASLAQRDHLAGPRLSAADLTVYPSIQLAVRAATRPAAAPLAARYPKLAAWGARIEALPGYDATYPSHWRAA